MKLSVVCNLATGPSAYISYALGVALQRNKLIRVYDGHLEDLQPLVFWKQPLERSGVSAGFL